MAKIGEEELRHRLSLLVQQSWANVGTLTQLLERHPDLPGRGSLDAIINNTRAALAKAEEGEV